MRRNATPKKSASRGAIGDANNMLITARGNTHLKVIKQIGRPTKTPTGRGLGKAGAKRLGRLLKRAIQQEESPARGKDSLPKTPVRLFKHQIQTEAENAPKTNTTKPASPHAPQLVLSVVSQCKHRGGISMAELKQTLAAGGYNVTKKNKPVTPRLVNDETLVRMTRNATLRLNNKSNTKQVRSSIVKSPKPKGILKQSKTASKYSRGAEQSQRQARKTPKAKGKTRRAAAKSHKPTQKTPKARKTPKPSGKKRRSRTNQAVRKAPGKAQRAARRQPKQKRHPYKSVERQPPRRRPRIKTQQRRVARRRSYHD
ncbi:histone H1-like [Cottoperca gobio]|uniref:Histone H1-like n=1 Tax=Cottoperca gobio TaxID=56716 RepID=A0A6J2R9S7_COTGO|nr:histone H1-like [Cottoperca gobio]